MEATTIIIRQAKTVARWLNAVEKVDVTRVTYNFAGEVLKRWAASLEGNPNRRDCPKSNHFNDRLASFRDRHKHLFANNPFEEVTQSKYSNILLFIYKFLFGLCVYIN